MVIQVKEVIAMTGSIEDKDSYDYSPEEQNIPENKRASREEKEIEAFLGEGPQKRLKVKKSHSREKEVAESAMPTRKPKREREEEPEDVPIETILKEFQHLPDFDDYRKELDVPINPANKKLARDLLEGIIADEDTLILLTCILNPHNEESKERDVLIPLLQEARPLVRGLSGTQATTLINILYDATKKALFSQVMQETPVQDRLLFLQNVLSMHENGGRDFLEQLVKIPAVEREAILAYAEPLRAEYHDFSSTFMQLLAALPRNVRDQIVHEATSTLHGITCDRAKKELLFVLLDTTGRSTPQEIRATFLTALRELGPALQGLTGTKAVELLLDKALPLFTKGLQGIEPLMRAITDLGIQDEKVIHTVLYYLKQPKGFLDTPHLEAFLASKNIAVIKKASGKVAALAHLTDVVGKGGFKEVVKGLSVKSLVALGIPLLDQGRKLLEKELQFSEDLKESPYIMRCKRVTHGNEVCLLMPFADGGTLTGRLANRTNLAKEIPNFIMDLCLGVAGINQKGWVHRDLKPDNILIDGGKIKITDFGLADKLTPDHPTASAAGSVGYIAPEFLSQGSDTKADAFSLGVMILELLGFTDISDKWQDNLDSSKWIPDILLAIDSYKKRFPGSKLMQDVLIKFIEPDPIIRLSTQEAVQILSSLSLDKEVEYLLS